MIKKFLVLITLSVFSFAMGGGPSLVNTAKVTKGVVNPLEEFIGTLNFSRTAQLASQSSGAVLKVNFEAGDMVKKGDLLVSIDSDLLEAQINSARAALNVAKLDVENSKKDYERYKSLIEKKSISQKTFDDSFFKYNSAKQNMVSAQARLKELNIQKEKKSIKAPFDGIVVEKTIEVSEWVSEGKGVASIVDTRSIDLMFNLPTSYVYKLNKEEMYNINLKGKTISSKLYAAIPKGDRRTRTFPVKFKADANGQFLYDGMEARISLPRDKKQESLVVPRDAVIKRFGQDVVFLNVDSKAVMIPVKIIGYNKGSVAVTGQGLFEGADAVIKGNERIFPDQPLKSLDAK